MKLCMGCMNQIEEHLSTCPYCGFNETALRQESYYLDPGTIVGGKYIVGKVMSYGGHTVSYLGMDAEINRKVIVKEYLPSDFSTRSEGEKEVTIYSGDGQEQFEQGVTNFLNEANRIQQLQDPEGIAKIYDCVVENETGYVISEYIEGKTLKEILDSGKKYSVTEARAFIKIILNGLSKVHHLDIVHCDISPEAIMITDSGDIKLLDFGATRYVTTANSKSLSIILKRGYAPEEQYRSRGKRGPWTDVYALAAVMYRMITGVVPQESVERVLVDELKEPSKLGVSIPENVENALMNALNVYQEERTPSAEAFLKELNSKTVKRIKVKRRKNKTGKFPAWAKCLVAGLFCVVAVGGVVLYNRISKEQMETAIRSDSVAMEDLTGMTVEEANAYIEKLNRENKGWRIEKLDIEELDTRFDKNEENNGKICSQSVPVSTVLSVSKSSDEDESDEDESDESEDPLTGTGLEHDDDGNVKGKITCTVYSSEKLHYWEISELNAFEIAQKLGIDTSDKTEGSQFIKEKGKGKGHNCFDLAKLQTKDGEIPEKKLKDDSNGDEIITYDKEMKIFYYASEFLYIESLEDLKTKNLKDLDSYPTYELENETERKPTGNYKSLKEAGLVDDSYCTFRTDWDEGYIFWQDENKKVGEPLDTSEGMGKLLHVIGEKIIYNNGQTGANIKAKIGGWEGVTPIITGGGPSQNVLKVTVYDSENKEIDCFRKGDPVRVEIETKVKPAPKPVTKKSNSSNRSSKKKSGSSKKKGDSSVVR